MKLFRVITMALMLVSGFAHSAVVNTQGLSDQDVAKLNAKAAEMVAMKASEAAGEPVDSTSKSLSLAATWGQQAATAAEGFAKAIGIAAKELNIEVNNFAQTPVGKITIAVIVMKIVGFQVIHALFVLLGGITVICLLEFMKRRIIFDSVEVKEVTRRFLFWQYKKEIPVVSYVKFDEASEGQAVLSIMMTVIQVAAVIFTVVNMF